MLKKSTKLRKGYNKMMKRESEMPAEQAERIDFYSRALWRLLQHFRQVLDSIEAVEESKYCF
jgi:hypothetical protein